MITPNETMFIIITVLFANGLLTAYACYLLSKRISKIETKLTKSEEEGK